MNEAQKRHKRKHDREAFQKKQDKLRGPTETARLKAEKEKRVIIKAEKELSQINSERKQQPGIMWERLLEGQFFEDVKLKPTGSNIERLK